MKTSKGKATAVPRIRLKETLEKAVTMKVNLQQDAEALTEDCANP